MGVFFFRRPGRGWTEVVCRAAGAQLRLFGRPCRGGQGATSSVHGLRFAAPAATARRPVGAKVGHALLSNIVELQTLPTNARAGPVNVRPNGIATSCGRLVEKGQEFTLRATN